MKPPTPKLSLLGRKSVRLKSETKIKRNKRKQPEKKITEACKNAVCEKNQVKFTKRDYCEENAIVCLDSYLRLEFVV